MLAGDVALITPPAHTLQISGAWRDQKSSGSECAARGTKPVPWGVNTPQLIDPARLAPTSPGQALQGRVFFFKELWGTKGPGDPWGAPGGSLLGHFWVQKMLQKSMMTPTSRGGSLRIIRHVCQSCQCREPGPGHTGVEDEEVQRPPGGAERGGEGADGGEGGAARAGGAPG